MKLAVIIAAGGASARYRKSKIDEDLGGRPALQRAVELFVNREEVGHIVVAGPAASYEEFRLRHADRLGLLGVVVCEGGKTHRWESVRNAMETVPGDCTHIAVHDAARPVTPQQLIDRVVEAARTHSAVVPGIDVPDTLKRVGERAEVEEAVDPLDRILGDAGKANSKVRAVEETVARRGLVLAQTPQVFEVGLLRRAYAQEDLDSTDDAQLVERLGEPVVVVEGDPRNVKMTRPSDLGLVRAIGGFRESEGRAAHKKF